MLNTALLLLRLLFPQPPNLPRTTVLLVIYRPEYITGLDDAPLFQTYAVPVWPLTFTATSPVASAPRRCLSSTDEWCFVNG